MRISDYWKLLRASQFRVHPTRLPMAFMVGGCSVINTCLSGLQTLCYKRTINKTPFDQPPLFIVGHWRSGTTLLHELMSLDPRLAFPNNYEVFVPHHFLISKPILQPLVLLLMPPTRPMDRMPMRVQLPQEDDFALCAMGGPTPYRRMAFPNQPNDDFLQLDTDNLTDDQEVMLQQSLTKFYRSLNVRYRKPLVLKSPPHTGRIGKLAEWFPGAKFIHLSRDPRELVPSTIRLWQTLDQVQGFQPARYDEQWLLSYIRRNKEVMYGRYLQDREELPPNQLMEIRFEDLVADPLSQIEALYEQLELGPFEPNRDNVQQYFASRGDHKKNANRLNADLESWIEENWQDYREAFGY
ncbi:MAG: sulfotransferase [Mariniblastus sp.]|nr:sulfotransferase [Mariniblastus sp.]